MAKSMRRDGRTAAFQFLYGCDLGRWEPRANGAGVGEELARELASYWGLRAARPGSRKFAEELVRGVIGLLAELDSELSGCLDNYGLDRLHPVDRNILRVGCYELRKGGEDLPAAVVINEAIELAKAFGSPESPRFVNGVMERYRRRMASLDGIEGGETV